MTNNKQTSIDWFFEQLVLNKIIIWNQTTYNVKYKYEIFLYQAKEMHKEEIINSFFEGAYGGDNISGEQYYNQTYGGGEQ